MTSPNIQLFQSFESVYGVILAKILPSKITNELENAIAEPHRHDCYSIIIVETGEAKLIVDFQGITLTPYSLLLIRPDQLHQTYLNKDTVGWILLCDRKIMDQRAIDLIEQSLQNIFKIKLNKSMILIFNSLLNVLLEGITDKSPGISQHLFVRKLLDALLFKSLELQDIIEENNFIKHPLRSLEITSTFKHLVNKKFRVSKKPSEYALHMNISVGYLNDTIKLITGFSSSNIIQQQIIIEAQRLLFSTSMSVKEIAFNLGYHDDKYFIRQFRMITKITPSKFRKQFAVNT